MALTQGISNILDYKAIAQAGQPQNLTGDALIELGALFTQMDFDFGDEDKDKRSLTKEEVENRVKLEKALEGSTPDILKDLDSGEVNFDGNVFINPPRTSFDGLLSTLNPRPKKVIRSGGSVINNFVYPGPSMHSKPASGSMAFRFKDDSPINRLQQEHPQILEILQDLRYKPPSEVDSPLFRAAHIASSPFVKTDDVDYRMMKRATIPEYAQRLGGAAAAGYNLVIDKYNYDQAVKKDYETELDDEMGDLNIEADTINENTRKAYLELAMGKKQKLNSLFQDYANNKISKLDFENGKLNLISELNAVATAQTNLTKLREEYLKNKGTYHIDASKKEMVDFYNTLEKNPESFTMQTIDGIDYFVGQTRQNKEVKVPTSKIANGTAGFRLVEKASITPVVASALKAVGTYSEEGMTDYGFGKRSASPERAKEIGVANIKNALAQDESKLRSFMASIYGVDHDVYQNFIGADPAANREEMLNDAAEHLYETQVKPQFFPTQKTTRIDPSKIPFIQKTQKSSAKERQERRIFNAIQQIGELNEDTVKKYNELIPEPKKNGIKYSVGKNDEGNFVIIIDDPNEKFLQQKPYSDEAFSQLLGARPASGFDAKSFIKNYNENKSN